jgi:hypothetical protein
MKKFATELHEKRDEGENESEIERKQKPAAREKRPLEEPLHKIHWLRLCAISAVRV